MGTLLKYIHLAKNQLFDGSRVALLTPLKETRYLLVIINQIISFLNIHQVYLNKYSMNKLILYISLLIYSFCS